MHFPNLETSRLILTKLSTDDSRALLAIFSDEDVIKFYDIEVYDSAEQSLKLIEFFNTRFTEAVGIRWAIRLKDTGKLIGTCGFNSWNQKMKNAGIGYELSSLYWGTVMPRKPYTRSLIQLFQINYHWVNFIESKAILCWVTTPQSRC